MSRHAVDRPWLHNASGFWCATIEGRRVYLDHDYRVACRKVRERIADAKRRAAGADEWLDRPFAELADKFLDHIQHARKPQTYLGYQARLERALKVLGPRLRTGDVRKRHLAEIEAALPKSLSPSTVRDTDRAVRVRLGRAQRISRSQSAGWLPKAGR